MTKEEQINALAAQMLALLNTPDTQAQPLNEEQRTSLMGVKSAETTLKDFQKLNVDVDVVRKIMYRVDEVYGKAGYRVETEALHETFDFLTSGKKLQ